MSTVVMLGRCPCCRSRRLVPAQEGIERDVPILWHCQSCDRWLRQLDITLGICPRSEER
jgi:hypothetical protein